MLDEQRTDRGIGTRGTVVVALDATTARVHATTIHTLGSLGAGLASIGLTLDVRSTRPCAQPDPVDRNTIRVIDRDGRELYRREIAASRPFDLADLIEHIGDVADGD